MRFSSVMVAGLLNLASLSRGIPTNTAHISAVGFGLYEDDQGLPKVSSRAIQPRERSKPPSKSGQKEEKETGAGVGKKPRSSSEDGERTTRDEEQIYQWLRKEYAPDSDTDDSNHDVELVPDRGERRHHRRSEKGIHIVGASEPENSILTPQDENFTYRTTCLLYMMFIAAGVSLVTHTLHKAREVKVLIREIGPATFVQWMKDGKVLYSGNPPPELRARWVRNLQGVKRSKYLVAAAWIFASVYGARKLVNNCL